jgi:hypothetical protein
VRHTQVVDFLEEMHTAAIGVNKAAAKAATKAATAKPIAKDTTKAGQRATMVTMLARWRMEQQPQSEETDENAAPCNRQPNTTVTPMLPPHSLVHVHRQQLPKAVERRVTAASVKNEMRCVSCLSSPIDDDDDDVCRAIAKPRCSPAASPCQRAA